MYESRRDISVAGDVIESSPRSRLSGPRRVVVVVVAVLAGAAWLVAQGVHPSTPSPSAEPMPTANSMPLPDHVVAIKLPPGIDLGTVLVPLVPPILADTAMGTSQLVAGVPGGPDWFYDVADLADGRFLLVAQQDNGASQAFLVTAGSATLVATGDAIVAGADGASVVVTTDNGTAGRTVQRYDLAGAPVGGPVALAADEYLDADTVDGYLVVAGGNEWQVRDPVTGQVRYRLDSNAVVAVGPRTLAYQDRDGRLAVDTLPTGPASSVTAIYSAPPSPLIVFRAIFSADGRYLAVDAAGQNPTDLSVLVLDTARGIWSGVPGMPVQQLGADRGPAIAWSDDVLALTTGDGGAALWRPGDPTVYAVPA
jgi:hypothetical protein